MGGREGREGGREGGRGREGGGREGEEEEGGGREIQSCNTLQGYCLQEP